MLTRLQRFWGNASGARRLGRLPRRLAHGAAKLSSGFYRLPSQQALLVQEPWNVLLVLDACRADYFARLRPDAARVRSLARFTHAWVWHFAHTVHPALGRPKVLWITANVVVDSELADYGGVEGIHTVPLWETDWEFLGKQRIASVHPGRVTQAVRRHVESQGQPERMIVHFLQPHTPYIGRKPLALAVAWAHPDGMGKYQHEMPRPDQAVSSGDVTWQEVRQAYMANLELVLPHALELASTLKGKVAITADHGEMLGERGLFGHENGCYSRLLGTVPWLEFDNGPFRPAGLTPDRSGPRDKELMRDRLEALGYM